MKKKVTIFGIILILVVGGIYLFTGGIFIEKWRIYSPQYVNQGTSEVFEPIFVAHSGARNSKTIIPFLLEYWSWNEPDSLVLKLKDVSLQDRYGQYEKFIINKLILTYINGNTEPVINESVPENQRVYNLANGVLQRNPRWKIKIKGALGVVVLGVATSKSGKEEIFKFEQHYTYKEFIKIDIGWRKLAKI